MKITITTIVLLLSMTMIGQTTLDPILSIPLPEDLKKPFIVKADRQMKTSNVMFYAGLIFTGMGFAVDDGLPVAYLGGISLLGSNILHRSATRNINRAATF